jgi:hypothetical protein
MKTEGNMKKTLGSALIALAFVFGVIAATSTTTSAQWRNDRANGGYNNQQVQQGFQYGVNTGASDAQQRKSYSPQRSKYFRDAPTQAFRDGFTRGYDQGYRQYSGSYGNNGGYGNGYPSNGGYGNGYPNNGGYGNGYPNNGGYGNGYPNGGYNNQEINAGYQQGINTGASDGRNGKSYSPQRSRYYQRASTQAFREGFVRGYDEGYRQYSRNGAYRRNNGAATAAQILGQILGRPY